ncbi:hypothetical protein BH20ACI4_BH20ACI4_32390 [soil metagenome]
MKKIAILSFCFLFSVGCNNTPITVQQNTNANVPVQKPDELSTVSSHSQDKKDEKLPDANTVKKSGDKTKWTQSGNPIDTTSFDSEIKQVEDKIKSNPKDETLKKSLADAYVARGMALTDARQYASALGDYRKALKLEPANETAKQWIGQIIGIYESINRSYPPEGEEPPPLPFKKES